MGAMSEKRTLTLNLSALEMVVLERLCQEKGLSKTAVMRQALRLYQLVDVRLCRGEWLFQDEEGEKRELLVCLTPDS